MRKIATIILLMAISFAYGQKSKAPAMAWRDSGSDILSADASAFSAIDKGKVLCCFSNNEQSVFIDLIIPDAPTQKKILDVGMNVWIDVTGKEKKELGVRYPMGAANVRAQLTRKGDRMTQDELMMLTTNSALAMAFEMEPVGFGEGIPPRIKASENGPFRSKIYYNDDGDLVYSLVIPSDKVVSGVSEGKSAPISIGIEYGASSISRPQGNAAGAGGAARSGPPAGGGGRSGGGGAAGGARPGGAMPSSAGQQSAATIVWVKNLMPASGR